MSTTYAELQTEIADWANRSDLGTVIPIFISIAEAEMQRRLRFFNDELTTDLTTVAGTSSVSLPADFNGVRQMYVEGSPKEPLDLVTLDRLHSSYYGNSNGKPRVYAISSNGIELGPVPDTAYTIKLSYYGFQHLSDANPTNVTLTNHPDLYFALTLAEAYRYLRDFAARDMALIEAEKIFNSIKRADSKHRFGSAPLTIRTSCVHI